ncbi:MAG: hypothetical protein J4224_04375 [Candidatus Diapherotrites archaeon]|uniref:Protein export membrane protein SecD/SecF C-terminal domain-containing protein n=1 Tax=Candidatus Iainarchaeum sp. TaxID=3101447 RepID=A0A7J4IZJ8_9ARCH|nr:MAG: hypothetical protein QT03_C0001G0927 [archaeon GW2011_AR10]MBS3059632.1 hypothetical protein [Candidatus Diapherotrites archaeon]HIH08396.1 hypothetical protein [Candidatus Diapherotrites archaeon]
MRRLLKNWKILLLLSLLFVSLVSLSFNGLALGVDFKGGTIFELHLAEKPESAQQLSTVTSIIQQRMDSFGLRDTKVSTFGEEFVVAQIAETDPERIEELEVLLKTQGKFEAFLDGNLLFTGSDIIQIVKDPGRGYGFQQGAQQLISWNLPFTLNQEAAVNFSKKAFHKCAILSYSVEQGNQYDCELTYFFIDRPANAVLVIPRDVLELDRQLLLLGNPADDIPQGVEISELLDNSAIPYFVVDNNLSEKQLSKLQEIAAEKDTVITHSLLGAEDKNALSALGFKLKEVELEGSARVSSDELGSAKIGFENQVPWTWNVTGAQQVIALSPSIANLEPFVERPENAQIFSDLSITGTAVDLETAQKRLDDLTILLETGSLPVPIDSISKETVSPFLGKEFLQSTFFIGFAAMVVVALVLYIRYRKLVLIGPMIFTGLSEVLLILGVASLIRYNLDLAAVTGILAAIGTGVDDQIIITDELLKGEVVAAESLTGRVKRAFFVIFAAASTVIVTMFPIIFFGFGLGKLVGFAITTITGVLIGVLITRPAYAEIARFFLGE